MEGCSANTGHGITKIRKNGTKKLPHSCLVVRKLTGKRLIACLFPIRHAMTCMSFFTKKLIASFLFSMLNGKKDNAYHYGDYTLIKDE